DPCRWKDYCREFRSEKTDIARENRARIGEYFRVLVALESCQRPGHRKPLRSRSTPRAQRQSHWKTTSNRNGGPLKIAEPVRQETFPDSGLPLSLEEILHRQRSRREGSPRSSPNDLSPWCCRPKSRGDADT